MKHSINYIKEKYQCILDKYSVDNPMYIEWTKSKLNNEMHFEF